MHQTEWLKKRMGHAAWVWVLLAALSPCPARQLVCLVASGRPVHAALFSMPDPHDRIHPPAHRWLLVGRDVVGQWCKPLAGDEVFLAAVLHARITICPGAHHIANKVDGVLRR